MAAVLTLSIASPPALHRGADHKQPFWESQSGTASARQCCSVLNMVHIVIAWFIVFSGHTAHCLELLAVNVRQEVGATAGVEPETHILLPVDSGAETGGVLSSEGCPQEYIEHQLQGLPGVKGMLTRLPRTNSLLPWMACGRRMREAELVLVPCAAA